MMLTDSGHFDKAWLAAQDTPRLRYEAQCENIRHAGSLPRHTLLLILGQVQVISGNPAESQNVWAG